MESNIHTNKCLSVGKILKCQSLPLKELQIPDYQRQYTWKNDKVRQLFNDFKAHFESEKSRSYYLGNLVLVSKPKSLEVLDGQQRLTTLYLYAMAMKLWLKHHFNSIVEEINEEIDKQELRTTLGELSKILSSLYSNNGKAYLNFSDDQDDKAFQFCAFKDLINDQRPNGIPKKHRILQATRTLLDELENYLQQPPDSIESRFSQANNTLKTFSELTEYLRGEHAEVTVTIVNSGMEFTIFETLNSRGEDLTIYDLTRNLLYSASRLPHIQKEAIVKEEFKQFRDNCRKPSTGNYEGKNGNQLVLGAWNMSHKGKISRGSYMNKFSNYVNEKIKQQSTTSIEQFEETMSILNVSSFAIAELLSPSKIKNSFCNIEGTESEKQRLADKLTIFQFVGFKQFYPLYFGLRYRECHAVLIEQYIHMIECLYVKMIFAFKRSPSEIEKLISDMSTEVYLSADHNQLLTEHQKRVQEFIESTNLDFTREFSKQSARPNIANFLLRRIEQQATVRDHAQNLAGNLEVEHVMPKSFNKWLNSPMLVNEDVALYVNSPNPKTGETIHKTFLNRLGNLTLIDPKTNKHVKDDPFSKKVEVYKKSSLKITREATKIGVASYGSWNVESIQTRQLELSKLAARVWSLGES